MIIDAIMFPIACCSEESYFLENIHENNLNKAKYIIKNKISIIIGIIAANDRGGFKYNTITTERNNIIIMNL
jgi:hypothetical protein